MRGNRGNKLFSFVPSTIEQRPNVRKFLDPGCDDELTATTELRTNVVSLRIAIQVDLCNTDINTSTDAKSNTITVTWRQTQSET
jgi:hypothetical protein